MKKQKNQAKGKNDTNKAENKMELKSVPSMVNKKMRETTKKVSLVGKRVASDEKLASKVAKGAAVVSLAAGTVAVGAALMDKKTREQLGKGAQRGFEVAKDIAGNLSEDAETPYAAVAHNISGGKNRKSQKKS